MKNVRNSRYRLITGSMLLAIACTSGPLAHADMQGARGGSTIDGAWSTGTCGFAMVLARFDPGFLGSALLICRYAEALDQ